jgi:hypothetical protein
MRTARLRGFGRFLVPVPVLLALLAMPAGAQEAPAPAAAGGGDEVRALAETVKALQAEVAALKAKAEAAAPATTDAGTGPEAAGEDDEAPQKPAVELHGQLHNLLLFRSDSDFDRRPPAYDENGQSRGAVATVFGPTLQWNVSDDVRVFYEAEIGLNYWSKNNPDQENALAGDIFVLKHRQIFAEGDFADGAVGFKVGYQYFRDTTGLFLGHWMGAAEVHGSWAPGQRAGLFFGMIPDTTFEGLDVRFNNFGHDIFVFGGRTDLALGDNWQLNAAVHALYDTHVVGRARWLVAPNVHLEGRTGWLSGGAVRVTGAVDAVLQGGRSESSALDGSDQTLLAWAAQGNLKVETKPVTVSLNVMALSADDAYQGNDREGAFFYSSKSASSTIFFTEDEVRNWYDQLDRRLGRYEGGFWQHRAGLLVGDVKVTLTMLSWFQPSVILGYGTVLQPDNALGEWDLGFEGNLDLAFRITDQLVARAIVGGMQPGKAAGALSNEIAPQAKATDGIWWTEAALSLVF